MTLSAAPSWAGDGLPVSNQAALARGAPLPELGRPQVLAPGASAWHVAFDLTNEFHMARDGSEELQLDGESQRYGVTYRIGVGPRFEAGITVPVYRLTDGILDGAIESWHDFFGLPNGGRDDFPRNRYRFRYVRDGQTVFDERNTTSGIGDVQFTGGWAARENIALRAMLKLPTGDASKLTGDDSAGGALWLDGGWDAGRWSGFWSAGGGVSGKGELLPQLKRQAIGFGATGLAFAVTPGWLLRTQLYLHSPLYDNSDIEALTKPGLQLTIASSIRLFHRAWLDLGFQEDPITSSSPDFSIHAGLRLPAPLK